MQTNQANFCNPSSLKFNTNKKTRKMNKEQMIQLQIIEQEVNQLNQQSELIEQNLGEMNDLKEGLGFIEDENTKEILVNIGKKIFLPVEIKSRELIVEVGNKNLVNKSVSETKELVEKQIEKLESAKMQIGSRLEELEKDMNCIIREEIKNKKNESDDKHSCDCDDDCEGGKCEHCECED